MTFGITGNRFWSPRPIGGRSRRRTRRLGRSNVDLNLVTLHAQGVRVERVSDEVRHALAAGAVETPLVVQAGDGLPVEGGVVQRHIRMRTTPAIGLSSPPVGQTKSTLLRPA